MGRRKARYTQRELFAAWGNADLTVCEASRSIGVTEQTLRVLARQHQLPPRPEVDWRLRDDRNGPPDLWGEPEPSESLDLCPWVKARIEELRLHERHLEDRRDETPNALFKRLSREAVTA